MTRFLLDTHAVIHWQIGTAMPRALVDDLDVASRSGRVLVSTAAFWEVASVALPQHHRDPFDRLFVAQAQSLRAVLVSRDAVLAAYDVATRWV